MKGSIRFGLLAAALGLSAAMPLTFPSRAIADPSNRTTRAAFGQVLPELKFNNVALKDALEYLRDVSDANIHVNWKALELAGVSQDTNVNMHLRNVSLRKALDLLLSEAGAGTTLTYYIDQGVIEVTTKDIADKQLITIVYPVQDLVVEIPDFTDSPDLSLLAAQTSSSSASTGGVGGTSAGSSSGSSSGSGAQSIFGQNSSTSSEKTKTREERGQDLVTLIRETVYPDVWRENGGPASIRYWNGNLVVTASRSVQEAIGGYQD